jgi:transglutaminase-like putative cysteine protease
MLFRIRHATSIDYEQPAYESHNEIRMRARDGPRQRWLKFALEVDPVGTALDYQDFYGNPVQIVSIYPRHASLRIVADSLVERLPEPDESATPTTFRDFLAQDSARNALEYDFLNPSVFVPFSEPLRRFFWMAHPASDEDVSEYVQRVVAYIGDQFEYEPGVTQVHSTADEILTIGGGVCQDFAHLTLGVLRLAGVPARYVSGYLAPATDSAAAAQVGVRASHAWIEAQLPGLGWVGFDPTHGCRADYRHLRVGVGRDYADVPPFKGVFRSAGRMQTMTIKLDIEPAGSEEAQAASNPGQSQSQQ